MEIVQDESPNFMREGVCILGGVVAVLMQVAHPKLALAVSEHSNFRRAGSGKVDKGKSHEREKG
jgi:uncharacterized protein (DUF2236 family)